MCFLVVGNVGTDIVGIRQQNIRLGGGGLSAIIYLFDLRVNVVPFTSITLPQGGPSFIT